MKRALAVLPLAFLLMGCPPTDAMRADWAAQQQTQETALAQAGERWRTTYMAGDWEALRALYTDDAVLMTQGQPRIEGADNIIAFLQRLGNAGASVDFYFEDEEVTAPSEYGNADFGFVTAKYRMDITFPGADEPTVVVGRSFLVYKWEDGMWKLWRDMDNLAPDVTAEDFK